MPDQNSTDPQDVPPMPDFLNVSAAQASQPGGGPASASPNNIPPITTSQPKKKFGGKRIIATILGILVLVGGVGAGIVLTQQPQLLQQKASGNCTCSMDASGHIITNSGTCNSNGTCTCSAGFSVATNNCTATTSCTPHCSGSIPVSCDSSGIQVNGSPCANGCSGAGVCNSAPQPPPTAACISDGTCTTGQTCCSGKSFNDTSCGTVPVRCGTKPAASPASCVSDGNCTSGQTCCSGKNYNDSSCGTVPVRCGTPLPQGTCRSDADCASQNDPTNNVVYSCDTQSKTCQITARCTPITSERCLKNNFQGRDVISICSGDSWGTNVICTTGQVCCKTDTIPSGMQPPHYECRTSCSGAAAPAASPVTSNPPSNPQAPSCIAVKVYSATWVALANSDLSTLTAGAAINFCVNGANGTFDKAQFKINTLVEPETTTKRPGSSDFCQSYTVQASDTTVTVLAKIHDASGYVGASF